ncbi:MAG: DUF882 domain-containing protein, partial [Polaromonas sp.]
MNNPMTPARRRFLRHTVQLGAAAVLPAFSVRTALASVADGRGLALVHTHNHEKIDLVYADRESYLPAALGSLNRFLRDHYSGDIGRMDP